MKLNSLPSGHFSKIQVFKYHPKFGEQLGSIISIIVYKRSESHFPFLSPLYVIITMKEKRCRNTYFFFFLRRLRNNFAHFWRSSWPSTSLPPKQKHRRARKAKATTAVCVSGRVFLITVLWRVGCRMEWKKYPTEHLFISKADLRSSIPEHLAEVFCCPKALLVQLLWDYIVNDIREPSTLKTTLQTSHHNPVVFSPANSSALHLNPALQNLIGPLMGMARSWEQGSRGR